MRHQKPGPRYSLGTPKKQRQGLIFVVSGPSGSGKTTLLKKLLKAKGLRGKLVKSVSLTTRPKRTGEQDSRDYFFLSKSQFKHLRGKKKLLEWTKYLDHYYATPREFVERQLHKGKNIILCLDLKGALQIKQLYSQNSVTIFILPPSLKVLKGRISQRGQETKKEEIKERLRLAQRELRAAKKYEYRLVNRDLNQVIRELKEIILSKIGSNTYGLHTIGETPR